VTRYKPPTIHLVSDGKHVNNMDALELIEPFVTTLSMDEYDVNRGDYSLIDCFYNHVNRFIFPVLERSNILWTLKELKEYFGTDLSRFKSLDLVELDPTENTSLDVQFGSLESLSLFDCRDIGMEILKQSLNTLQCVWLKGLDTQTYAVCFELLAPIIPKLTLIPSKKVTLKQIMFSKLTDVTINAYSHQIVQFFSVTHPLLTKIQLQEYETFEDITTLAQQPSIRYIATNASGNLTAALMKAVNQKVLTHIKLCCSQRYQGTTIDLSSCTNLKLLQINISPNICFRIEDVLKQNKISSLSILHQYSIMSVLPYLSSLWYLNLSTLDESTFVQIMKLPHLNTLHVNRVEIESYGHFTKLLGFSRIKNYSIKSFRGRKYQYKQIHVIPHLESMRIEEPIRIYNAIVRRVDELSSAVQWILFVTSTLNVDTVDYGTLKLVVRKLLSECFTESWFKENVFITPINHVVQRLKNALNEVLEQPDKYLQINEMEQKMILDGFNNSIFDEKQLKDSYTRHPAVNHIIQEIRNM
jgi:hypothetical protein